MTIIFLLLLRNTLDLFSTANETPHLILTTSFNDPILNSPNMNITNKKKKTSHLLTYQ